MCADFTQVKESLVDKILEQGQKLRNAMVQSILQNDPMCSNIIYNNKICNTPVTSATNLHSDRKLIDAFLNGDYLTKDQEELALNSIRSMPLLDICETTQRTLSSNKCSCATCTAYSMKKNLKCDLRRSPNIFNTELNFKHVDSLKVILQSIYLNAFGDRKVNSKSGLNETYFIEYYLPEIFVKNVITKSKTDSGLENNNHVRVCARRTSNSNVIHIKQTYIHSVCNLYNNNLEDYDITFFIKYKTKSQSKSELLGIGKFNLGWFKYAKNASCGKSLPIHLNEESPIRVGTLKVTLQLGAGKLYFGQEFLDAISSNVINETENDQESIIGNQVPYSAYFQQSNNEELMKKPVLTQKLRQEDKETIKKGLIVQKLNQDDKKSIKSSPVIEKLSQELKEASKNGPTAEKLIQESEGELLFGFLYISEANFLNLSPNSYILCQPYCQNDTSSSRIIFNSSNPLYNFCQTIPLLYEESLLLKLRENFMVIEFWEKQEQTDILFGSTRLPLHQFYLGYRNSIILKHLKRNKLPIIGTDWWEPIYSVDHNELIGQVQVLTALGTKEQITNLEIERGFKNDVVKAKFATTQKAKNLNLMQPSSYFKDRTKVNNINKNKKEKIDVAIQSDLDNIDKMDKKKVENPSQDMLASFLKILEQRQRPQCVENSTNTEIAPSEPSKTPQLKKTSELLDSLTAALTAAPAEPKILQKPPHFRARIIINGANQLPSRRKIKTKSKRLNKNLKQDDNNLLPSTYVTFETLPGEPLQLTNVFPKSTQPQWNFSCEVCLPMDLLKNGSKRLIFKVWKKSTNAVLQPNMQTDLVLGFAALDLSVLAVGLPNVQGWFNIVDFSGKCNGQINIHVIPLDKIEKIGKIAKNTAEDLPQKMIENEDCNEVLSRALKRKFTELDEITQRLRLRLSEVVSDDSEGSNDDITDEFEHDINNLCVEDDFDLINFEDEARKFNEKKVENKAKSSSSVLSVQTTEEDSINEQKSENLLLSKSSTSSSKLTDINIIEGKQRIDTLLEKLTLITAETSKPFSDRYVSGCSNEANDIQDIFNNLEQNSRPNITATNSFDPVEFQQFYDGSGSSGTSVITSFSECRPNPVGHGGTTSEDKEV